MRFLWQKSHADRRPRPLAPESNEHAYYIEGMMESAPLEPTDDAKTLAKVCLYVMYGHRIYQSVNQPVKVANPARVQLNRENEYSPAPVR